MNNLELLNFCKSKLGQGYIYGAYFDRIITEAYIQAKAVQYPLVYTSRYIQRSRKWIGQYSGDCVGLIKAAYWTDPAGKIKYRYNNRLDLSANGMYNTAAEKGKLSTMPEIPGVGVHYNGHIGVYIGNGEVIEARGVDYGVVKTRINDRPWLHWLKIPYIAYDAEGEGIMLKKGMRSDDVALWQKWLMTWNNEALPVHGIDSDYGSETEEWTNRFLESLNMTKDGIVTFEVIDAMMITLLSRSYQDKQKLQEIRNALAIIKAVI